MEEEWEEGISPDHQVLITIDSNRVSVRIKLDQAGQDSLGLQTFILTTLGKAPLIIARYVEKRIIPRMMDVRTW